MTRLVGVVAPEKHPALDVIPEPAICGCEFVVGSTLEDFKGKEASLDSLVWIVPGSVDVLEALWEKSEGGVKWIHSFSAGVDGLGDFLRTKLAASPNVIVTNGRSAFSASLAEYVMAAALHFNKQVPRLQANKQAHKWDKFVMPVLAGKTMGFLGFGDIPKATAKIAKQAFGMKVIALRRNTSKVGESEDELVDATYDQSTQKLEVFKEADFVVCVLPGTPATQNFVSTAEFAAMKPSAVFISIGRGVAVDEDALAKALHAGSIAGACLDVFQEEPLPKTHPLWDCPNLLMSAHNADLTDDYFELGWGVWKSNSAAHLAGNGQYATPIDKALGY